VWESEDSKSLGPNDFNFNFIPKIDNPQGLYLKLATEKDIHN